MLDFSKLQTPPEDGDVLVEPPLDQLERLAEANREQLCSLSLPILDIDLQQIRTEQRCRLCPQCMGPIVMTGHQPEFIHAGVWAKHVVASRTASRLGGRAVNLVIDSDVPGSGVLEIPSVSDGLVTAVGVPNGLSFDGVPFEHRRALDRSGWSAFAEAVREAMGDRYAASCMEVFFEAATGSSDEADWVDQMVSGRRNVERDFGIEMVEHRISRVFGGPMVADMLLQADRFAACYNAALADYRRRYRVRSVNRPIPDLQIEAGRVELPLWAYKPRSTRQRLFVETVRDSVRVYADETPIADLAASDLGRSARAKAVDEECGDYVIRPRALAVTLWARVFAGDLFIHGIGGAKYDRITDELIRRYYGIEPPSLACVSATLRSDLPVAEIGADDLRSSTAAIRDLQYNPHRHGLPSQHSQSVLREREQAVCESVALRRDAPRDRRRRRSAFQRIRSANERLVESAVDLVRAYEETARDLRVRLQEASAARRRDYFFALHSRFRLAELRDKLAGGAGFGV